MASQLIHVCGASTHFDRVLPLDLARQPDEQRQPTLRRQKRRTLSGNSGGFLARFGNDRPEFGGKQHIAGKRPVSGVVVDDQDERV
ncbi:MAG TPA: hypothetical protein VFA66_06580 [Gaiellaceae bacterium]|nr:hypothetical protein [Gaiellaceae bacterium]